MLLDNPTLHSARVEVLPSNALRITIPTFSIKWRPGQHVFVRFLGVRPLESHPFTIANAIPESSALVRDMTFIIRPHSGFTLSLFNHVLSANDNRYRVLVDGPYGEGSGDLRAFDRVLFCIGGSGISWALSALQDLSKGDVRPHSVKLVWAIRDDRE